MYAYRSGKSNLVLKVLMAIWYSDQSENKNGIHDMKVMG